MECFIFWNFFRFYFIRLSVSLHYKFVVYLCVCVCVCICSGYCHTCHFTAYLSTLSLSSCFLLAALVCFCTWWSIPTINRQRKQQCVLHLSTIWPLNCLFMPFTPLLLCFKSISFSHNQMKKDRRCCIYIWNDLNAEQMEHKQWQRLTEVTVKLNNTFIFFALATSSSSPKMHLAMSNI